MSEIIIASPVSAPPLPAPRVEISIRAGTLDDLQFMDELQRKHTRQVGWMPTAQFEGKIKLGHVLIAEERDEETERRRDEVKDNSDSAHSVSPSPGNPLAGRSVSKPIGYVIGNDQYFKRDDLGIIYQLNVVPGKRRHLVGATLLKAMFERAAWGCKLFCCWCAQDIEANHFWEACGFVPLAFRTGSRTKGKNKTPRVHIFWQKRIRPDDTTTAWWFPSQTSSGSIREDRLVLPIPPGTHWSDAKPVILPGAQDGKRLEDASERVKAPRKRRDRALAQGTGMLGVALMRFDAQPAQKEQRLAPPKPKRPKQKNDPKHVAAARELRDRYLEEVNRDGGLLPVGKYDVARALPDRDASAPPATGLPKLIAA